MASVKKVSKKKLLETIVKINRHQIGSIDLADIIDVDALKPSDKKIYLQEAEVLWSNPVFQNETKKIIRLQLEFIGMNAEYFEQMLVGRGTINGCDLLRERIEKLHLEYKDSTQSTEEKFDEFEITP